MVYFITIVSRSYSFDEIVAAAYETMRLHQVVSLQVHVLYFYIHNVIFVKEKVNVTSIGIARIRKRL